MTQGLAQYQSLISTIRARYGGTPIGASESIVTPLAAALGLKLLTPQSFLDDISEGNDPTAADKATIDAQIEQKQIKIYVYNSQNATPDVAAQVQAARARGIPVATVTETLAPADVTFQAWQVGELRGIEAALAARHRALTWTRGADMASSDVLRMTGAAVRVGGRTLWSGVDLSVGAGEFVAVLGPNGVGKSTLVKVILGLIPPSAGTVTVFDGPPGRHNDRIGYLPQRRNFEASLRVRGIDIVRLGLNGDRFGIPFPVSARSRERRRAEEQRISEVIELVDATDLVHRPIGELSGGEQQRLLIAQALVRRPALLLLDEPLDSLDLPNQSAVAALVSTICREAEVSVVMVAHDVNPILSYLDRVVYIAEGGVAAGSPHEVITGPTLSRLYQTPIEVLTTTDGRLVVVGQPEAPAHHADRHGGSAHGPH